MNISDGEKLGLLMLADIHEAVGARGEIDPKFIRSAIFNDHLWGIGWRYSGIPFSHSETPPMVSEVANVLDMWTFIEESVERLEEKDRKKVEDEAEPFGRNPTFPGFDGNNESEYLSITRFLLDDLGRFERFKGRELNSHMPTIDVL